MRPCDSATRCKSEMSCERSDALRADSSSTSRSLADALEVGKQLAPSGRQVERVRAPVDGVAAPLGEPALLEVVDERDHGAAVDPQRVAQRLLGLALGGGEVAEHSEVPGMEVEPGEALGEVADARECRAGPAESRRAGSGPAPGTPARWGVLRTPCR